MKFTLLALSFFLICVNFVYGEVNDHLKFEGDIILSKYEMDHLDELLNGTLYDSLDRNAIKNPFMLWPGGVVPYIVSITGERGVRVRKVIEEAMAEISNKTCIRFKPLTVRPTMQMSDTTLTNDRDYIDFVERNGCWSRIGRFLYGQEVSIGDGCDDLGTVQHEIMHALGFWHEHSRADRDEYIQINFENIIWEGKHNFEKNSLNIMSHLGAEYDYCSIMHYSPTEWSENGKPTIVQKKPTCNCEMGYVNHLSDTDIREINTLYKCKGYPQIETNTTITTSTPKSTGRCVDNGRNCTLRAQRGECELWEHSEYMHNCCAQSCNTCPCITTSGDTCVFPFTYGGNDYNGCTNVDNNQAWCATKEQQTGSWWGNCPSECRMHTADSSACPDTDIKYDGQTFKNVPHIPNWQTCGRMCKEESGCSYWTWNSPDSESDPLLQHWCALKGGGSRRIEQHGFISGVSNCQGLGSLKLDNDVPYIWDGSKWMPICGHYFWDNNIGADIVCQNLGYSQGGVLEEVRGPYNEDAYYVGRCDSVGITDLVNGCTKEKLAPEPQWFETKVQHSCKKGSRVSIKVKCKELIDGTCYEDDSSRLLDDRHVSATNTPDECIRTCASQGFSYAGVQYFTECFCGKDEPPASRIRDSSQCDAKCPGDASLSCGGSWRMNIYAIEVIDGTCYEDDGYRLLDDRHFSATNTPNECIGTCASRGFAYAGVTSSTECFCGNNEPPASRIRESSQCDAKCPGDASLSCGGTWRMNIYTTVKTGTN